jgi:hemoglobin-like flavoprotein
MNEEEVVLVQATWQQVVPIAGRAADIFYAKLFELDPSLRAMFPADLTEQKQKLMSMLGRIVSSLERLETVVPTLEALGKKHLGYGVKPEHYNLVGAALMAALQAGLGPAWNPEARAAWASAYGAISRVMVRAGA